MAIAAIRAAKRKRLNEERRRKQLAAELSSSQLDEPRPRPVPVAEPVEAVVQHGFWKYQLSVRRMYEATSSQAFVAVLIVLNFLCNVVEKEMDPHGVYYKQVWRVFEHSFNAVFLLELLINMYSRWLWIFWRSGWNVFDFVVVAVGCISFGIELEGPLKLLRTLRAFRVFRLFKRIKALNMIIVMIVAAIPGVINAFLVMVISISIYALIAVVSPEAVDAHSWITRASAFHSGGRAPRAFDRSFSAPLATGKPPPCSLAPQSGRRTSAGAA